MGDSNNDNNMGLDVNGLKNKQNIQVVFVTRYNTCFELQFKSKTPKVDKKLVIEKSGRIYEIGLEDQVEFEKPIETKKFSAFLGIQYLLNQAFLVFAEDAAHTCTLQKHDIFTVCSLGFMPFERNKDQLFAGERGDKLKVLIENVRKLFSEGYYFSYTYDLSLSKQKQAFQAERDWRFCWNSYMCKDIIAAKVSSVWTIPLVQGYISNFQVYIQGKKLDFYLMARRSCKKAGTRYNARGVDDDGNVANYCELEQMFFFNQYCCSHLQIRGSVPIFWRQRGITAQTKITRSFEFTNSAFMKHFEDIKKNYQYVLCVNLMKKSKEQEQMITEGFETHIRKNNLDFVKYKFFDFHTVCKDQKYEKVNPTIRELHGMNSNFLYYAEDLSTRTVIVTQKGAIRTNCLDCLDRTNVFQSKIALDILSVQLEQLGVSLAEQFNQDPLDHVDNNNLKQNHPFITKFKCVWADCGDMISKHYTGTGSTHTDVTKKGSRDIKGLLQHGYKSISRFYLQNFEDNVKQEAIDIVVGQHTESVNIFNESVEKALIAKQDQYSTFSQLKVLVLTWNVSGLDTPTQIDQSGSFFGIDASATPDIVVIGLQEVIELNAKNFVSSNNEQAINKWNSLLLKALQNYDNYILTKHKDLYGTLTLIYSKQSMQLRISKINEDTVKLGITSSMGGVNIKLYIDDTSINVLNVNLDSGSKSKLSTINDIHVRSYQQEAAGKTKDEKLENIDYNLLIGDLGFGSQLSQSEVTQSITGYESAKKAVDTAKADKALAHLLKNDEFTQAKGNSDYLSRYTEEKINFLPTYKYDKYTSIYSQSTAPSWADRIMIWPKEGNTFTQLNYNRRELNYSSHRPVYATFHLNVKKINQEKKEQALNQVYSELNQTAQRIEEEEEGQINDEDTALLKKQQ